MINPESPRTSPHLPMLVAAWLLMVFLLQLRPVADLDLFWQVRLGQLMLDEDQVISTDTFTFTRPDQPAAPVGWLAEVIFAVLYRLGSWTAIQTVHVLLFAGAFALAGASVRHEVKRPLCLVVAVFLGFMVSLSHSTIRTQGFALVSFALLMLIATNRWPTPAKLLAAVPLLLFWQNAHPSVLTAAFWLGPLMAGGWLRWWRQREPAPWALTLLLILVGLSQLATPMGADVFAVQSRNLAVSRDLLGVSEWLPSWDEKVRAAQIQFWLALLFSLLLLRRVGKRVRVEDLGVFLILTVLTLLYARFALFWALAMVPVLARWIELALPAGLFAPGEGRPRLASRWPAVFGVEGVLVGLLFIRGPTFADYLPIAGIEALKQDLPAGRIYNYYAWAGPLVLWGRPEWRIAIDTRLYLYDDATWLHYDAAATGSVPVAELDKEFQPDAFFLRPDPEHQPIHDEKLIERLRKAPDDWREIHADANCVVFVRNKARH